MGNNEINFGIGEETCEMNYAYNPYFSDEMVKEYMRNVDNLPANTISELFKNHYKTILDSIYAGSNDIDLVIKLFNNKRFLTIITPLCEKEDFEDEYKIKLNKLVYDYIMMRYKDKDIEASLLGLAKAVNKRELPKLYALSLPRNVAENIVIARYSSSNGKVAIKRMNAYIMRQPEDLMTEDMITKIYFTLFNRAYELFETIMYDVKDTSELSDSAAEIYGAISLSILDVVESLPENLIRELLILFSNSKKLEYPDKKVRFNLLATCQEDYPKLHRVMNYLISNNEIIIPY